jgi:N-acetyl-anhydromuramyl-L-alanine amidase AmpD
MARPRTFVPRKGDEIIVAGRLFHTGTRVVTWMDPHGYDAYRTERRFSPLEESSYEKSKETVKDLRSPARYGLRRDPVLAPDEIERVRGGGWDLPTLQNVVDQFVIHYDVAGISKNCFKTLHDLRGLSVHFMLDIDGTIYQTLDLKERAYHATTSNTRSVGIEIANMGAYPPGLAKVLDEWYPRDAKGPYIKVPERFGDPMIYTKNFVGRPARPELVHGVVQGTELFQYDLTPEQYAALTKLTAALCKVFPKMTCDYPRDADGKLVTGKLPDEELKNYHGVLGHFHVQTNKTDPGPAFDWDRVIDGARRLLHLPPRAVKPKAGTAAVAAFSQ